MRAPTSLFAAALLLVAASAAPLAAQQQVIETEDETIEFFGLERWTAAMVRGSLTANFRDRELSALVCAGELVQRFGFVRADVSGLPRLATGARPKRYLAITVVEPGGRAPVAANARPVDSLPDRDEWVEATSLFRRDRARLAMVIQDERLLFASSVPTEYLRARPHGTQLRDFIARHDRAEDRALARWTLAHDANAANRAAALLVLAGHAAAAGPARDSA